MLHRPVETQTTELLHIPCTQHTHLVPTSKCVKDNDTKNPKHPLPARRYLVQASVLGGCLHFYLSTDKEARVPGEGR